MPLNTSCPETSFRAVLPCVAFTTCMFFLSYFDRAIFGPVLPLLEADFSVSHAESTRCLLYLSIGYAFSVLCSAVFVSLIKARTLAGTAVVLSGFVLLCMSVTTNWALLSILFTLLGFTTGLYFNGGMTVMRSVVPEKYFGMAISIHELGPSISFVLAPIVVQVGSLFFSWQGIIALTGVASIFLGLLYCFFGKSGRHITKRVSLKGLQQVFFDKRVWLLGWFIGLGIAGEFAPFSVLTLHLTEDRHLSSEAAATLLSSSRLIAPIAVLAGGWLTWRFGAKKTLIACFLLLGISILMLAFPSFFLMTVGLFVHPVVTALIFPPVFTVLAEVFSAKDQSLVLSLCMPIAGIIGTGVMPTMLGLAGEYFYFTYGFIFLGALFLASIPLVTLMKK